MIRRVNVQPAAQADLDHHAEYLAERAGHAIADRFLIAIYETFTRIADAPGMGAPWVSERPGLAGIRHRPIAGFPNHLLFYRYDDAAIAVLRLLHARQDLDEQLLDEAE